MKSSETYAGKVTLAYLRMTGVPAGLIGANFGASSYTFPTEEVMANRPASGPRSAQKVNPNAQRDLQGVQQAQQDAHTTMNVGANAVGLDDLNLRLDYMKPADLAKQGAFFITQASERVSRKFNQDECVFEITLGDAAEYPGAEIVVTLPTTPVRKRLVNQVQRTRRPVGPCYLYMMTDERGNDKAWAFLSEAQYQEAIGQTSAFPPASDEDDSKNDKTDLPL